MTVAEGEVQVMALNCYLFHRVTVHDDLLDAQEKGIGIRHNYSTDDEALYCLTVAEGEVQVMALGQSKFCAMHANVYNPWLSI